MKQKNKISKFFDSWWENFKKRQEALQKEKETVKKLEAQWKDEEKKSYVEGRKQAARIIGKKKAMKDAKKEMEAIEEKDDVIKWGG
jgi:hypothetical protein